MIYFGTAGTSLSFKEMGYKKSIQIPEYLQKFELNAFEYQCGRGVKISEESARKFGGKCTECDIKLSLHAPYYISLSSVEEEKRDNSIRYILESARAIDYMGGSRVIVHSGSCSKMSREEAVVLASDTITKAVQAMKNEHLEHIRICPETMGKINQLGTLDEVVTLCKIDESLLPCVDFGHINARTLGGLKSKEDFLQIFDTIENELGEDRMKEMHVHFSKIEYTKGGEKKHLTFQDEVYGPDFEPLAEIFYEKNCSPTIICESDGTQAEDAKTMLDIYTNYANANKG